MNDERTTAHAFHEAPGVQDWRVLFWGAYAHYRTESLQQGARFVMAVAAAADQLGHSPDIDLRPEGVTLRTSTRPDGGLGPRDIELARRITEAATAQGLESDPSQLQVIGVAVAQDVGADVRPFWLAAFGYTALGEEDALDPQRRNPHLWFHPLHPPKPKRGRYHIDLSVPAEQAEARVAAAVAAGGRIVDDSHVPWWWTLASPDNHGLDIAAWPDIEDDDVP